MPLPTADRPRNATHLPVARLAAAIALVVVAIDQATKHLAFRAGNVDPWIHPVLNDHTGWELLYLPRHLMIALVAAAAIVGVAIAARMMRRGRLSPVVVGLVAGGSVGNLIDRVAMGSVRDFLLGPSLGVFNLADVFLAAGCIAWMVGTIRASIFVADHAG